MREIKPSLLYKEITANARADIPTMIWGGPGLGKSQIVYQTAHARDSKLFELRANLFDPVDVRGGLKVVEQADGTYRTRYGIPEDYPDASYQGSVTLFIDELPVAPKATQNALLQLILDKKIGTYTLPPYTTIIAAGNRSKDRAAVHEMPTPVKSRFAHYTVEPNVDDWCVWAMQNQISPMITSFIRYRPQLLHAMDAKQNAFPTPRGWEMVDKKLPHMGSSNDEQFYGVASIIGDGPAGEFIAHKTMFNSLPDIDKIIKTPHLVDVPDDTSVMFAISGALAARVDDITFKNIVKYMRKLNPEYQVYFMKDSLAKDRALQNHEACQEWIQDNASVVI